ncbi:MAG: DEAD/DEAH box helicase [Myxococcales bacterium]|nr:DEAD/DEAH box helicase [Myxococcales bacterium]
MPLSAFHPVVARWFTETLGEPSEPQRLGWPSIAAGDDTLIAAPTGTGKTLAAFLWALDALLREAANGELGAETRVLYVSPLKALSNDIERNLQQPLAAISEAMRGGGHGEPQVTAAVRTGDTPQSARARLAKSPPHILVTTPESLYILLTSESGRRALASVRTVIVDEIHALIGDKRGAHLALSLQRLERLASQRPQRIGLSATQRPIERVAQFLSGAERAPARIVDCGHRRHMELILELPESPLEAVMATEVWEELYDRLAALVEAHRTTLIFVNTRRLAERVARHLAERLGPTRVTAHHGSLSREHRLRAEQRLKHGELSALVATASLELGIDIGHVEIVCQLGTTRSIGALLQRVGRSGHFQAGVPRGHLFPLSRDELVEAAALFAAIDAGELDALSLPEAPIDILAQQLVAMAACEDLDEDEAFELSRSAAPFGDLPRERFDALVRMLCDGFATDRGRRGALLHHDRVGRRIRGRRGARLTAITNGGAIPDNADYSVVLEPAGVTVGTLNEDFAIESMAGDVFQLGNSSYRIRRVEKGVVRVDDAHGVPPTIPFWLGEAPARSPELSERVSKLRQQAADTLGAFAADDTEAVRALEQELSKAGLPEAACSQLAEYLAQAHAALGTLPTTSRIVVERFFDEAGGMQLVLHSPFGGRINRAMGLALRKRFCRSFNFELQAAATEDAIILSLGPTHSFPLDSVREFLHPKSVRQVLIQALLLAPMFEVRWRWNAGRALAVPRFSGGRKVAPFLQRMRAADLLAVAFPDQQACAENLAGDREVPDHPLVEQTVDDCLHEAMDIEGLESLLERIGSGEVEMVFRELNAPSPLCQEILGARPYAFLDDAPLEERRTHAVMSRRLLDVQSARELGALDAAAVARVREEAWPSFENADELHDAILLCGLITSDELAQSGAAGDRLAGLCDGLTAQRRIARMTLPDGRRAWVSAEWLKRLQAIYPPALQLEPPIEAPAGDSEEPDADSARIELCRARLECSGPLTAPGLAQTLALSAADVDAALHALEAQGFAMRGHFDPAIGPAVDTGIDTEQWCERRLLARIHRYTLERLRREIEPVSAEQFMRFLFRFQHLVAAERQQGPGGVAAVVEQLAGFEAAAVAWEAELLSVRVQDYDPAWLDQLCLSGQVAWGRLSAPAAGRAARPLRSTPIALTPRPLLPALRRLLGAEARVADLSANGRKLESALSQYGACFIHDLPAHTGLLPAQVRDALAELSASGRATSDGYAGLRALLTPERRGPSHPRRRGNAIASSIDGSGRWSLLPEAPGGENQAPDLREADLELLARRLLMRWGVIFRKLAEREALAPWRDLSRIYRSMEARGEIRGGRFVAGFTGEQFALPAAVTLLRQVRREAPDGELIALSAADPLNLIGRILPGERVPAIAKNRLLFRDGRVLAVLKSDEVQWLGDIDDIDEEQRWNAQLTLRRRKLPPTLRAYS